MKRAACYVRVSTENQLENYSIEEQIDRLKSYCKAKDWTIYKIYTDGGYSGGNTNRPALNRMIDDIHHNRIDLVVVYKLDRLSRSQKDTLMLIEDEFLAHGVDFVSMNENFDTSTPFGRAMIGILSVFAQLEKDQITERFTMGRIGRCRAGYFHGGGNAPTGYDYIDGKLIINPVEAKQVQEIYQRFLKGKSIDSITKYIIRTYNRKCSAALISNILTNSIYIGKVKFKGEEADGIHQPIISLEDFKKAKVLMESRKNDDTQTSSAKTPFRASYMLTSLIYCARCGARYSACHGYYKCYSRSKTCQRFVKDPNCKNDNWKISELDELIKNEIHSVAFDEQKVDRIFENQEAVKVDVVKIKADIRNIDTQISRMLDLYQIGSVPLDNISDRIKRLEASKQNLVKILEESNNEIHTDKEDFKKLILQCSEVLQKGDIDEMRLFVSNVIQAILIDGSSIKIKWRI